MKKRLTQQLSEKGVNNANSMAKSLLIKQGNMTKGGKLTPQGRKRASMSNADRAIDREIKIQGKGMYGYNPKTNKAYKTNKL